MPTSRTEIPPVCNKASQRFPSPSAVFLGSSSALASSALAGERNAGKVGRIVVNYLVYLCSSVSPESFLKQPLRTLQAFVQATEQSFLEITRVISKFLTGQFRRIILSLIWTPSRLLQRFVSLPPDRPQPLATPVLHYHSRPEPMLPDCILLLNGYKRAALMFRGGLALRASQAPPHVPLTCP